MKKLLIAFLCLAMVLSLTACGKTEPPAETIPTIAPAQPEVVDDELKAKFDEIITQNKYQGIVYLTHNGKVVYQSVSGNNDLGEPLTMESPMFIASISKQFCAAAILMLRDQGKLSLDDTLIQYFPQFAAGKDITLKHMLSMRSGISNEHPSSMLGQPELYANNTADENLSVLTEYFFSKPLNFAPDSNHEYTNCNAILLSLIVEKVSGQEYEDFIRQNIFAPLGMTHSGFLIELAEKPDWAQGLTADALGSAQSLPGITQGCGDIVSTAADMDIWMRALRSGQIISEASYKEMTTNYSADQSTRYGYCLSGSIRDGWGHGGTISPYSSMDYFNDTYGYQLFVCTNRAPSKNADLGADVARGLLLTLYEAVDTAETEEAP